MKRNRWVFVCVRERFLLRPTHVRRKANSSCAREPCMGAGKQTSWAEVGRGSEGAMYVVRDMQVPRAESRVKRRASILSGRWCNPHVPFSVLSLPLPPRMLHPPARTWETQFIIPSIIDFVSCHRMCIYSLLLVPLASSTHLLSTTFDSKIQERVRRLDWNLCACGRPQKSCVASSIQLQVHINICIPTIL